MNRLSDLLFVLARIDNKAGQGDVLWHAVAGRDTAPPPEPMDPHISPERVIEPDGAAIDVFALPTDEVCDKAGYSREKV